eukprot:12397187-Alexandrium_andersonii.AAC.1
MCIRDSHGTSRLREFAVHGTSKIREFAVHGASFLGEFAVQETPRRRLRCFIRPCRASGSDSEA